MISPYVHHIHSILLCPIRNNKNALTKKKLLQKHIYYFRKQLHYLAIIYYLALKKVNFYNNLCKIQKKNMQQFNLNAKASIGQLTRKLIYIINRYSLLMAPLSIHLPLQNIIYFTFTNSKLTKIPKRISMKTSSLSAPFLFTIKTFKNATAMKQNGIQCTRNVYMCFNTSRKIQMRRVDGIEQRSDISRSKKDNYCTAKEQISDQRS